MLVIGAIVALVGIFVVAFALLNPKKKPHEISEPQQQHANANIQTSDSNEKQSQAGAENQKEPSEKIESGFKGWVVSNEKWLNALSTGFIAIFTIVLAVGTVLLYCATQRLVEGSDDTSQRELRAYLGVTGFHVRVVAGEEIKAQILLTNAGKTPAYHVRFNIATLTIDEFPPPIYVPAELPAEPEKRGVTTAPNGGTYSIDPVRSPPLTQLEFNALLPNTRTIGVAIYIKGVVTYFDAFNIMRTTRFYGAYGGQFGMGQTGAVAHMDQGNESN